jgi:amino-acid N-acetyltransferase
MKVSDLRGILQYVPRFRERIFVIAIDGEVLASPNFPNILLDIAVLRSLNIRVVLVHGAAFQIQAAGAKAQIRLSNADGTGITDDATLEIATHIAINLTNEIMQGLTNVDLRAAYANTVIAHPAGILGGIDNQNTGRVERVDDRCLELFLNEGIVPVIPPLGFDGEGRTFRVNSDAIALEVAEALHAAKIIFISAHPDVVIDGIFIAQLSVPETEDILKKHRAKLPAGTASKLDHAARACRLGIPRVHLINGNLNEALLTEIFSNEGVGTMIFSNDYQQIRRIYKKDVRNVMNLIRESVDNEELIHRTRADIIARIEDYWVLEIDRRLVGCVALHGFPDVSKAELACLYVAKGAENQGHGKKLMAFVENLARERNFVEIFALSTRAFNYLHQKGGFVETTADSLPPSRREKYDASGRNSKVLVKKIAKTAAS